METSSYSGQLAGGMQKGELSGVAVEKLQGADTIELNRQYTLLSNWEKRIYRQVWARVKQFWNEEKWIRVTDNQDDLRWVGLNSQITLQQKLEETINDESISLIERTGAAAMFQEMMQSQDPRLQQPIEVRNDTTELDVDIILDQSFDVINIQQEQFRMLVDFAQGSDIDIIELIELSKLRGKDELIQKIEQRRQAASEAAGNAQEIEAAETQSKAQKNAAAATKMIEEAKQTMVQTKLLLTQPPKDSGVVI